MDHKLSDAEEIELLKDIAAKYQQSYEEAIDLVSKWQKQKEHAAEMLRKIRSKLQQLGASE